MTRAVRLVVRGRVQGVGYRAGFAREATRLGLTGWVRNRRDGSVEALVNGDAGDVAAMEAWARRGPPVARVDEVEVEEAARQALVAFEVRSTV